MKQKSLSRLRLAADGRADDRRVKAAREACTLRKDAQTAPPMDIGILAKLFNCTNTPHLHLFIFLYSYITTCLPDGGDFFRLEGGSLDNSEEIPVTVTYTVDFKNCGACTSVLASKSPVKWGELELTFVEFVPKVGQKNSRTAC